MRIFGFFKQCQIRADDNIAQLGRLTKEPLDIRIHLRTSACYIHSRKATCCKRVKACLHDIARHLLLACGRAFQIAMPASQVAFVCNVDLHGRLALMRAKQRGLTNALDKCDITHTLVCVLEHLEIHALLPAPNIESLLSARSIKSAPMPTRRRNIKKLSIA